MYVNSLSVEYQNNKSQAPGARPLSSFTRLPCDAVRLPPTEKPNADEQRVLRAPGTGTGTASQDDKGNQQRRHHIKHTRHLHSINTNLSSLIHHCQSYLLQSIERLLNTTLTHHHTQPPPCLASTSQTTIEMSPCTLRVSRYPRPPAPEQPLLDVSMTAALSLQQIPGQPAVP